MPNAGSTKPWSARGLTAAAICLALAIGLVDCEKKAKPIANAPASARSTQPAPKPVAPPPSSSNAPLSAIPGLGNERFDRELQDEMALFDPAKDGWDSEVVSEKVLKHLKELGHLLESPNDLAEESAKVLAWVDDAYRGGVLQPAERKVAFERPPLRVTRAVIAKVAPTRGKADLISDLAALLAEAPPNAKIDAAFKNIGVQPGQGTFGAMVRFQLAARSSGQTLQRNAFWRTTWSVDSNKEPKLASIEVIDHEDCLSTGPVFAETAPAVIGADLSYPNQMLLGLDDWRERIDWRFGLEITGPHGLAVGDANGDGLDDVLICEPGGLPNRLYVQRPDGTAVDIAPQAGLDALEPTHSALFLDLDNDGDQDLAWTVGRYVFFFENDGKARFTKQAVAQSNSVARSMAAADFDSDGDLDVFVCGYFSRAGDSVGLGRPMPYHDANNGVENHLLANQGGWKFLNVTDAVGLNVNNRRFSYAAAWEDYDNDGDPDLYVANDFGRNNLYRNDGGKFLDVAAQAGVEDISAGMSASWADYNRDGKMDLYVGNMFSSAGNRIAYQRNYKPSDQANTRQEFQRHARGNTLFENAGDGTFRDVTMSAGVNIGRWAWGSNFVDLNNDGWEDLVVANGMVTAKSDPDDL